MVLQAESHLNSWHKCEPWVEGAEVDHQEAAKAAPRPECNSPWK